jgi:hypothetical protein
MADDEEPILTHPGSPEMAKHVHDYESFTRLLKWGAVVALITAFIVLLLIA